MITSDTVKLVKVLRPLENGIVTLCRMQGHSDSYVPEHDHAYSDATHYMTIKNGSEAELADPNKKKVTQIERVLRKEGSCRIIEVFLTVYHKDTVKNWYLVTDERYSLRKNSWGDPIKNEYPHLKPGETVYFVYEKPIPDKDFKIVPFKEDYY